MTTNPPAPDKRKPVYLAIAAIPQGRADRPQLNPLPLACVGDMSQLFVRAELRLAYTFGGGAYALIPLLGYELLGSDNKNAPKGVFVSSITIS